MPKIPKETQPPLPPPGESVGILKQMSCVWVTPKPGSKLKEPYQAFRGTLQLHTGEKVPVSIPFLEQTAFMLRNLCKSAELLISEDESEFLINSRRCRKCQGVRGDQARKLWGTDSGPYRIPHSGLCK